MAKQKGIGVRRRIFVLDEADSLTPAAQKALRQVMEDSHKTAIFILTANDISPIHKAIRDRCLTFRFKPLTDEEARDKLTQIHSAENLPEPWLEQYTMLNRLTNGSLRQSIDILEGTPKTDGGLLQKLKSNTESLNKAALSYIGENYQRLALHLKNNLREGEQSSRNPNRAEASRANSTGGKSRRLVCIYANLWRVHFVSKYVAGR